jgi:hypothetical protein
MIYLMRGLAPHEDFHMISDFDPDNPNMMKVMEKADSVQELLHKLRSTGDPKRYVVFDYISNTGETRTARYPMHKGIDHLAGFIDNACDISLDSTPLFYEWQVNYVSELWVQTDEYHLVQVRNFQEHMKSEVENFIRERSLR